jgi:hypothetical protein
VVEGDRERYSAGGRGDTMRAEKGEGERGEVDVQRYGERAGMAGYGKRGGEI